MPAGRPSDYDPDFCHIAHDMAQEGATDREIAQHFEIDTTTFYRWQHAHPEFRLACSLGKESADDRVERSLFNRAVGYSFDAIKIQQYEGVPVITPYVEHVPPDPGCMQFWLKNRRGDRWREKSEVSMTGEISITDALKEARGRLDSDADK